MLSINLRHPLRGQNSPQRRLWNAAAWNDIFLALAGTAGLMAASVFLYLLGPVLGTTLIGVALTVWSLLRSQIASDEEDRRPDQAMDLTARGGNPVSRKTPGVLCAVAHPVVGQGA